MTTGCTFCSIIAGGTPANIVFRDCGVTAFLDRRPLFPGHTLVVPDGHHETLPDLPADHVGEFFAMVQRLARVMPDALDAAGTFVAMNNIVSQSVPHLHVHVVPRRPKDGLKGFFWPRNAYDDDRHAIEVAERLCAAWSSTEG